MKPHDAAQTTRSARTETDTPVNTLGISPVAFDAELANSTIAKNTIALTAARGVTAVLALIVSAYLTRVLSPRYFGILGFGTALLSYFSLLVTLGFSALGAREIARQPAIISSWASRITSLKLFLCVPVYLAFLGVVIVLPKDPLVKQVLAVQGLLLFGLAISVEWVYQGIERMGVLAVRNVAVALLHVCAVVLFVREPSDILLAAGAAVAAVVVGNVWIMVTYTRDFEGLRFRFEPDRWKPLIRSALPIAASSFMIAVFYSFDQVMIGLIRSETEVGLYTAGYRLLIAALVPAQIIYLAFFPSLSASFGDAERMRHRAALFTRSMAAVGLPVAVGGAIHASPLLAAFAGSAYLPGAFAFALLMTNAGLVYINMAYGQPLIAWNRQKAYFGAVGAGAATNIVLNALLIPSFGLDGAAAATVLSELVVFFGVAYLHWKAVRDLYLSVWARAALAAGLGVGGVLLGLQALGVGPLWAGLATIPAYGLIAWALKVLDPRAIFNTLRNSRES